MSAGYLEELSLLPCRHVITEKKIKKLKKELNVDEAERAVIARYHIVPTSGWEAIQGRRWDLQDTLVALDNILHYRPSLPPFPETLSFYAVFDGHGGREVSDLLETLFLDVLLEEPCLGMLRRKNYPEALRSAFSTCGKRIEEFCVEKGMKGVGSCATVALLAGHRLVVANVGDSEVFLGRRVTLMSTNYCDLILSQRHTPKFPPDAASVVQAGGRIIDERVEGKLAITRAFGDISLRACGRKDGKDLISYEPFVRAYPLSARDDFVLLACDGLFDVLKPKYIAQAVRQGLSKGQTPTIVCERLIGSVMNLGSSDNVSALLVYLYKSGSKPAYPSSYQQ
ncbi:MAG: PP2C family protein-serine/threonine phosphatase [archaeon]|nr:PP2C family protein-serine/threonine phosphatase [archaeon]